MAEALDCFTCSCGYAGLVYDNAQERRCEVSGYCPDCGNTLCVCAEWNAQKSKPPAPPKGGFIETRMEVQQTPPKAEVREFWIAENWEGATVFTDEEAAGNWYDSVYKEDSLRHVILYSAYLALKAELENQKIKSEEEYRKLEHLHALTRVELKRVKAENITLLEVAGKEHIDRTMCEMKLTATRQELEQVKAELVEAQSKAETFLVPETTAEHRKRLFTAYEELTAANERAKGLVEACEGINRETTDCGRCMVIHKALLKYKGDL